MTGSLFTLLSLTEVWVVLLGLAAFLAVFWVLRGAPVGQAVNVEDDDEAPRSGYRDRVVTAICAGILLILTGGYLVLSRGIAWSIIPFMLGYATVFALVVINQRYRHGSPTMRRTLDLSNGALNASLLAGVLIVVNVVAFRYGGRAIDLTQERAFSLSSLTVNQLKTLGRPVTFTTFFGRSNVASQQFDRVRELLELYKASNPEKISIEHVDPYRDLSRYDALVKRVPAVDVTQSGGIVVEYGAGESSDRVVVRNNDLFDVPRAARFDPDAERFESIFKGEDALTTALIQLREGKKPKVVFTTGHGEPSIEDMDASRASLGLWKSRLTSTGFQVVAANLLTEQVSNDTSLIIVVGPRSPFKPDEVSRLKAFSDRGGPVLLLLGDSEATGLEPFLSGFKLALQPGFVVEPKMSFNGRVEVLLLPISRPNHPIIDSLDQEIMMLPRASPLKINGPVDPTSTTITTTLLKTTPQSWAERDLNTRRAERGPDDLPGPLDVGVAVNDRPQKGETQPGPPRLVLFSCPHIADNALLQLAPKNLDLLMNSVNWLRGRVDLQGIAPKSHVAMTLTADPAIRARLILVPTVMAVLLIITLGVATYLARRS